MEKGIKHYVDVGNVIAGYYKNPDKILERVEKDRRENADKISSTVL